VREITFRHQEREGETPRAIRLLELILLKILHLKMPPSIRTRSLKGHRCPWFDLPFRGWL
jgi:hypothetical protein